MTFCIAISKDISAPVCPLEKGKCYWQHRKTHKCAYTEQELDSEGFAKAIGMSNYPTPVQVGRFLLRLREELKAEQ